MKYLTALKLNMCSNFTSMKYDDTVQCFFYSTNDRTNEEWEELCDSLNKISLLLSEKYIWHKDVFKVSIPIFCSTRKEIPYYLTSITCFGDNIEDEWFIVYLVLEITKQYPDIIVQIEDNDGDFLLIEAADYLPSWANPENTENRVFIHNNKVHIIDPTIFPLNSNLKLCNALLLIQEKSQKTAAAVNVQQAILRRISNYPQKIEDICHMAVVRLPVELATILTLKPSLISPIVNTYCNIDTVDKKYSRKSIKFENSVTIEVKFSKCLYAMLKHSKDMNCFTMTTNSETDNMNRLGMKLLYAYEAMMNTSSKDIYLSTGYKKFINNLTKNGYFKENLEGSKDYKELIKKANEYFLNIECLLSSYVSKIVSDLKETHDFEKLRETLLKRGDSDIPEGQNEDWLNIHPDELNEFLNNRYSKNSNIKNEVNTPEAITSQLTKFLKQSSDFEGIERRDKDIIEDDDDDDKIELNSDEFVNCVEKMLNSISFDTNLNDQNYFSEEDDENDFDYEQNVSETTKHIDAELSVKLQKIPETETNSHQTILNNLVQSMKEEGPTGPSSNILSTIGVNKTDLLDSDDDSM